MSKAFSRIGYGVVLATVILVGTFPESILHAQKQQNGAASTAVTDPKSDTSLHARIDKIAHGIDAVEVGEGQSPVALDLEQLMKLYQVPALSVAVIDDYKIAWAKA